MPAYSVSKAGLNAFVLCLREQLRGTNITVIELSPPAVQSKSGSSHCPGEQMLNEDAAAELHDYMGEDKGRALGMPLVDFTNEAMAGLFRGQEQIYVGSIGPQDQFDSIVETRQQAFQGFTRFFRQLA